MNKNEIISVIETLFYFIINAVGIVSVFAVIIFALYMSTTGK